MEMKKYMVYMDDGQDCFKCAIPAKSEKEAREYVKGNGEVVAVKDVTDEWFISAEYVADALERSGFGRSEIDIITRTLQITRIAQ